MKATLPADYVLHESYVLRSVLGIGGFGVTYLAEHSQLSKLYAIKEYWPDDFATRNGTTITPRHAQEGNFEWGLQRFLDEAQTLARFRHRNIIGVSEFFRANGTAYMVLDYESGRSLKAWRGGLATPPTQDELDLLVTPLLEALEQLYAAGVLHRDIAPDNIYIRDDGTPVPLDFGAAREAISQRSHTMSAIIKPGYSPPEQYSMGGSKQGPWTDIYALSATLYEMVTGAHPPEATERILDDHYTPAAKTSTEVYRPAFLEALDWGLKPIPRDRPQSVREWRRMLLSQARETPARLMPEPAKAVADATVAGASTRRPGRWVAGIELGSLLAAAAAAFYSTGEQPRVATEKREHAAGKATSAGAYAYDLFPLKGMILGKSTVAELAARGKQGRGIYNLSENKVVHNYYTIDGINFWHDGSFFNSLYIAFNDNMPSEWERLGLSFNASFSDWLAQLKKMEYDVHVTKEPTTEDNRGAPWFTAALTAQSTRGTPLVMELDFRGREKVRAVTVGTLKSIWVKTPH